VSEGGATAPAPFRGGILLGLAGFGASTFVVHLSRLVVGLIAAGLLGPRRWGIWQVVSVLLTYGALCHLGALNAMNREVPIQRGAGRNDEAVRTQRATLGAMLLTSLGCAALGGLVAWLLARGEASAVVLPAVGLFLASQLAAYVLMSAKTHLRFPVVSAQQLILGVLLPLVVLPATIRFGLPGFVGGQAVAVVLACALVGRHFPGSLRPGLDPARTRELIRIGFPILTAGVTYLLLVSSDRWIAVGMLGVEAAGHYGIVAMVLAGLRMVTSAITQYVYPRMAQAWGETGDPAVLESWSRRQTRLAFLLLTPAVVVCVAALPPIIRRFLPDFAPAAPALLVSVPILLAYPLVGGYGNILNILDRQRLYLAMQAIALAVNVGLSVALVLVGWGIVGIALGTTVSFAAFALLVRRAGRRACRERAAHA
jgi:O-antigen/teichoic acid export membrane protein